MLTRSIKLKINQTQEKELNQYLWHLEGVYNWAIQQIKVNTNNGIYLNYYDLSSLTANHAKKIGIHSQVFQSTLKQAYNAWERCFNKLSRKPKFKSKHRRLKSFLFLQLRLENYPKGNKISLPGGFNFSFHKQTIPEGKIKTARIQKKASGWYLILTIDTNHKIKNLKETDSKVGIDTGFHDLAVLSDGTKYLNDRIFIKAQEQLAKVQRGGNKKKIAKSQEHLANKRKDRNHKISTEIIQNHKEIYITNDNLVGQATLFGKSVSDAGIAQLRNFLLYKGLNSGRKVALVDSRYTTMTCSVCESLTGPRGLNGLAVRHWVCSACGAQHDRDINSGQVVLNVGLGLSLVPIPNKRNRIKSESHSEDQSKNLI